MSQDDHYQLSAADVRRMTAGKQAKPKRKYGALRAISWGFIIAGVLNFLAASSLMLVIPDFPSRLVAIAIGVFGFLVPVAVSELITLAIDVEENTRATARLLGEIKDGA